MKFGAGWNIAYGDTAYLSFFSDFNTHFEIQWGDGSSETRHGHSDDNGGRTAYSVGHDYGSDGSYDVTVTATDSALPAVHLDAFLYSHDTAGITLVTSDLQDLVLTGSGANTINVAGGGDSVFGGDGIDNVSGGKGADSLAGGGNDDVLNGGAGNDRLYGENGDDQLYGGKGDDYLRGDEIAYVFNDQLFGGEGNDKLQAAFGADQLTGGSGADLFVIETSFNAGNGSEVMDFSGINGERDKIDLDDFGRIYTFIGHRQFDDKGPEIREFQGATNLDHLIEVDQNGDGQTDMSFTVHGDSITLQDFARGVEAPNLSSPVYNVVGITLTHPFLDIHPMGHPLLA